MGENLELLQAKQLYSFVARTDIHRKANNSRIEWQRETIKP